jgi:hypothetical protein
MSSTEMSARPRLSDEELQKIVDDAFNRRFIMIRHAAPPTSRNSADTPVSPKTDRGREELRIRGGAFAEVKTAIW